MSVSFLFYFEGSAKNKKERWWNGDVETRWILWRKYAYIRGREKDGEEGEDEGKREELAFYSCRDRSIFAGRFVFVFCRLEPLEPTHCSRIQDGVHRHLCHRRQCRQQRTPLRNPLPLSSTLNCIRSTGRSGWRKPARDGEGWKERKESVWCKEGKERDRRRGESAIEDR